MSRGQFSFITERKDFRDSKKTWHISLSQCSMFWFELIANPSIEKNTRTAVIEFLKNLKADVEEKLEKRFIYFFCSRKKMRFDDTYQPRKVLFSQGYKFKILIGKERRRKTIIVRLFNAEGKPQAPSKIEVDARFVTIFQSESVSITQDIHTFLSLMFEDKSLASKVHYVGYTKNPHERPVSREHRGIADTLYKVSNEDNDFFLYVNLFKVMSFADPKSGAMFNVNAPNSSLNEVPVDQEGRIVESVFINYFQPSAQSEQLAEEKQTLASQLRQLALKNKIQKISAHFEVEPTGDYYNFGSESIAFAKSHTLCVELSEGKLVMQNFSNEIELASVMYDYKP
jgi:hypothetical protein